VRVFRFDVEVSRPIAHLGSRFDLSPLIESRGPVVVSVLHLPAGGGIGRHPAAARRLLAIVDGAGSVSGADCRVRPIRRGYAALWDEGEEHGAHSDVGLTAVCVEGAFDVRATAVTRDIVVVDHDPGWTRAFERLRDGIWPAVADVALRIDHVGSTAVPGLAAKPIIDLDIVVASDDDVQPAIERLATVGYRWRGNLGIAGREAFEPARSDDGHPEHHLYLVVENNRAHLDHWLFRDLLRADGEARRLYGELKRRNAAAAGDELEIYLAAKAAFVAEHLTRARAEHDLPAVDYWQPGAPF